MKKKCGNSYCTCNRYSTMGFTCNTSLVAKFLFLNLDWPNLAEIFFRSIPTTSCFWFVQFSLQKRFLDEAHYKINTQFSSNFSTRWRYKNPHFIRKPPTADMSLTMLTQVLLRSMHYWLHPLHLCNLPWSPLILSAPATKNTTLSFEINDTVTWNFGHGCDF